MAYRESNNSKTTGQVPNYYARNRLYPGAYQRTEWETRRSRRIHDGFVLSRNYGLDTVSDDINSSPYSSPYYINGRYNSDALVQQRGSSASVQGIKRLASVHSYRLGEEAFDGVEEKGEQGKVPYIELWQGKQIKFKLGEGLAGKPIGRKIVGNIVALRNVGGCTGILSMYFATSENDQPIYETAIDLCEVSQDRFEKFEVYGAIPILPDPSVGELWVRMEIWDEIEQKRSRNPFNTGRKIQIAMGGDGGHQECVYRLGEKNLPVKEEYDYKKKVGRPLIGLICNDYTSVPVDRIGQEKNGATVSLNGYRYDIMCCKTDGGTTAEVLVYDRETDQFIENDIRVDGRVETMYIAQATDLNQQTWVYYVDGYSPLQRFKIGEWQSYAYPSASSEEISVSVDETVWWASDLGAESGYYEFRYIADEGSSVWKYTSGGESRVVNLGDYGISLSGVPANQARIHISTTVSEEGTTKTLESVEYVDVRPVVGASLILFHNNRLYLSGFRNDRNLLQISEITEEGPLFDSFPYRTYVPNRSPYDTSINPITAMAEYQSDEIMILGTNFYARFQTNVNIEDGTPQQVASYTDSAGVLSQGDVINYKGVLYSFDRKEGWRRYSGSIWTVIPNSIDSHYDRVDMKRPRKMWGYANKLYYSYMDKVDGKRKCLVWDSQMNYQTMPFFQDADIPFCDVRHDEQARLIGIHPDYPCVLEHYAPDVWRRLDTPITMERHSKHISVPGLNHDMYVKRVHVNVLANANRWAWLGVAYDTHKLCQERGRDVVYRMPIWDTITVEEPPESAFAVEDIYEEDALKRLDIEGVRIRCTSIQLKFKVKTFRGQVSLVSVGFEVMPRPMQ